MDGIERNSQAIQATNTLNTGMELSSIPVSAAMDQVVETAPAPRQPSSGWARLLSWFGLAGGADAQIAALSAAIADDPDAPMNYVLRGETLLQIGALDAARADFERALGLAQHALRCQRWGLVAQAAQDRAAAGLSDVLRRLGEPVVDEARTLSEVRVGASIGSEPRSAPGNADDTIEC